MHVQHLAQCILNPLATHCHYHLPWVSGSRHPGLHALLFLWQTVLSVGLCYVSPLGEMVIARWTSQQVKQDCFYSSSYRLNSLHLAEGYCSLISTDIPLCIALVPFPTCVCSRWRCEEVLAFSYFSFLPSPEPWISLQSWTGTCWELLLYCLGLEEVSGL